MTPRILSEEELAVMSDSAVITRLQFLTEETERAEALVEEAALMGDLPRLEEAKWLFDILSAARTTVDDHVSDVRIPDLLGESEAA